MFKYVGITVSKHLGLQLIAIVFVVFANFIHFKSYRIECIAHILRLLPVWQWEKWDWNKGLRRRTVRTLVLLTLFTFHSLTLHSSSTNLLHKRFDVIRRQTNSFHLRRFIYISLDRPFKLRSFKSFESVFSRKSRVFAWKTWFLLENILFSRIMAFLAGKGHFSWKMTIFGGKNSLFSIN